MDKVKVHYLLSLAFIICLSIDSLEGFRKRLTCFPADNCILPCPEDEMPRCDNGMLLEGCGCCPICVVPPKPSEGNSPKHLRCQPGVNCFAPCDKPIPDCKGGTLLSGCDCCPKCIREVSLN